ncbi:hypothetical protein ACQPZP_20445 [Spirillospora sp. CA-142024]|uniref:hypothetical protein n=1 Tax=Spirillospora sp. CA-142024 TaxID=3240036 RepID=UPI003D8FEFD4
MSSCRVWTFSSVTVGLLGSLGEVIGDELVIPLGALPVLDPGGETLVNASRATNTWLRRSVFSRTAWSSLMMFRRPLGFGAGLMRALELLPGVKPRRSSRENTQVLTPDRRFGLKPKKLEPVST